MIVSYVLVFICVWWIIFYMALPFSIKTISPSKRGYDSGAPKHPHLGIKILITTIIAACVTMYLVYIIEHGQLSKFVDGYMEWLSGF